MEDRNIVGGKIVYAIGAPQTNSFERFEERLVQLNGGDYAGVVSGVASNQAARRIGPACR